MNPEEVAEKYPNMFRTEITVLFNSFKQKYFMYEGEVGNQPEGFEFVDEKNNVRYFRSVAQIKNFIMREYGIGDCEIKLNVPGKGITEYLYTWGNPEWELHAWEKRNAYSLRDNDGFYDLWECAICGESVKRRGLHGSLPKSRCPNERRLPNKKKR